MDGTSDNLRQRHAVRWTGFTPGGPLRRLAVIAGEVARDQLFVAGTPLPGVNTPWMVVTAVLIAIVASYTALDLAGRVAAGDERHRRAWLAAGALAMGTGIWCMHFVGMLGYRLPVAVSYDVPLVALSIVAAILASAIGLSIATRPPFNPAHATGGALAMGMAIAAMHYIGMAAMRVDAVTHYRASLVFASCVIAVLASGAALSLAFYLRAERQGITRLRLAAAVVMGIAISGMHYTAMAAAHFSSVATRGAEQAPHSLRGFVIAPLSIATALVVLTATLASSAFVRRMRLPATSKLAVPPSLIWGCFAMTIIAVAAVGGLDWRSGKRLSASSHSERTLTQQLNELRYLDEALTMTAHVAVRSSDPMWRRHYDSLGNAFSAQLARLDRAMPTVAGEPARQTISAANDLLVGIEEAAMGRAARGDLSGAQQLLAESRYQVPKHALAAAIRDIADSLAVRAVAAQQAGNASRQLGLTVAVAILFLLAMAWAGIVLLLRNALTAKTKQSDSLAAARDAAEAANVTKSEFLARMSHELRTPLSAVIGFANVLYKNKGGRLSEADLLYVQRIQHGGRHLLGLINEILDLAKLESGAPSVVIEPVDLSSLVVDAVHLVESRLERKPVRLTTQLPPSVVWANTDGERLTQVLVNLIGNAIKFTEKGTIVVRLLHASAHHGIRIEVADTGAGIPPHRLSAIFEPFEQADTSTSRRHGGTGLGLSISRSLAEALGGTLSARSTLGAGSTFTLELGRNTERGAPVYTADEEALVPVP